jgi:phosphoribosylformylglycinamidine synthase PurS subunit
MPYASSVRWAIASHSSSKVHVTLKPGVNAPQGQAIRGRLRTLGFGGVEEVRSGRYFEVRLDAID